MRTSVEICKKCNDILIHDKGKIRKIAMCKVKPYDLKEWIEKENNLNNDKEKSPDIQVENNSENIDNNKKIDAKTEEIEDENEMRRDLQNEIIGPEYLQREKSVYYMDYEAFLLEVPGKEHGKPEIVNTNNKIENLKTYETFEEVLDEG